MRIAVFSDIHGNRVALDAVLADIRARGGADAYWVLGDTVAIGADPVGVLERLAELPTATFVQGNTERYVLTDERPYPSTEDVLTDPSLLLRLMQVTNSFAWTQGAVTSAGWFAWLSALPVEQKRSLPDGTRVLLTHVAPGVNDGPGIHPELSDEAVAAMVSGCQADLVVVGHTHWPLERRVAAVHVVNDGSVSNPWSTDLRASYALIAVCLDARLLHDQHMTCEPLGRNAPVGDELVLLAPRLTVFGRLPQARGEPTVGPLFITMPKARSPRRADLTATRGCHTGKRTRSGSSTRPAGTCTNSATRPSAPERPRGTRRSSSSASAGISPCGVWRSTSPTIARPPSARRTPGSGTTARGK
jgi:predicted phosphodiesterase